MWDYDIALRQQQGRPLSFPAAPFVEASKPKADTGRCRDPQDVRCNTAHRSPRGSLILARGPLRPPLHPPDHGRCPLDPTRGAPPSGHPAKGAPPLRSPARGDGISPLTLAQGRRSCPLDPQTQGSLRRSPVTPIEQGFPALHHDRCSGSGFGINLNHRRGSIRPCLWQRGSHDR